MLTCNDSHQLCIIRPGISLGVSVIQDEKAVLIARKNLLIVLLPNKDHVVHFAGKTNRPKYPMAIFTGDFFALRAWLEIHRRLVHVIPLVFDSHQLKNVISAKSGPGALFDSKSLELHFHEILNALIAFADSCLSSDLVHVLVDVDPRWVQGFFTRRGISTARRT